MDDIDIKQTDIKIEQTDVKQLFKERYKHPEFARRGGFFRPKRRKQLLGILKKTGRDRPEYDFWYDVRENVKTALIDLQLFFRTANESDFEVIDRKSMEEVLDDLLYHSKGSVGWKAAIAQKLVVCGLSYLEDRSEYVTRQQKQTIEDAIEASTQIMRLLHSEKERKISKGEEQI